MEFLKLKVASLFAGAGGLDLGFKRSGHELVWANDFDRDSCLTYARNIGDHIVCGDVAAIDPADVPEHDILIGGFPCQGFSRANIHRVENDERNNLYLHVLRFLSEHKPKFFLLENVRGIVTLNKGKDFSEILSALKDCGYKVEFKVLNAADFGVPQNRIRVIITGVRDDLVEDFEYVYLGDSRKPFIATPREHSKTIFYEQVEDHWRLHLGEPQFEIPEPQLLIENLRWHGTILDTQKQIDAYCEETGWTEEQLFAPMDGWDWETQWEHNLNPEAQAFRFLSEHDIFPRGTRGQRTGEVVFEEFSNPMSCWRWVEVHDPLSLSLLQARLNELKLGVEVREYVT